jgi:hypothetical protein
VGTLNWSASSNAAWLTVSSASGTAPSTLTASANISGLAAGTYNATITLTASGATNSPLAVPVTLTIGSAGAAAYDATLHVPACNSAGNSCDSGSSLLLGRGSLGPEQHQPNTLDSCADGTSGTYHSDESLDALKVSTTDGSNFAPGKTVKIEATVWAYSSYSSDSLDLYYAADASAPSWTFIGTVAPTAAGSQVLSKTYTLPTGGSMQAVRGVFRYSGSAGACTTGGYDDHDDIAFAVGSGGGDTTAPTTSITSPTAGATVNGTVTISASASDNVGVTKVEFYVDGSLLSTDTSSPYSASWNTTTATNGSHSLTTKAYDAATNVGTSSAVSVTVNNSSGGAAVYDSTLKAPKCASVDSSCDAGTLINGRGSLGPESNASNTINASCSDGTSGTYHSDESLDSLKVSTTDGSAFAAGKTVRIDAKVWAYSSYSSDHLDLYYAANANSPTWTFIGTLNPTTGGQQTLSTTYTLPSGSLQAIRGQFRYNSSAGTCSSGSYNDRDDLIFAVGP